MKKILWCLWTTLPLLLLLPFHTSAQNLLNGPESAAYDPIGQRYLISNVIDGKIIKIDNNGQQDTLITGLGSCLGNCISNGVLYVSCDDLIGIDLTSNEIVLDLAISTVGHLDGMTADTSGHLYVVDTGGRIIKVDLATQEHWIFVSSALPPAFQDIIFDPYQNRLIAVGWTANATIKAVSLEDSTVSSLITTTFGYFDGVTTDQYGNIYVGSYSDGGRIYMFDNDFQNPPELIATGMGEPAGLDFNQYEDVIASPNFSANSVNFIEVDGMNLSLSNIEVVDDGNGDGRADPGETCELYITISNHPLGYVVENVSASIFTYNTALTFTTSGCNYGTIQPGNSATNTAEPFIFSVDQCDPQFAEMYLVLFFGSEFKQFIFPLEIGRPPLLLVDDDGDSNQESFYQTSFEEIGRFVDVWNEYSETISEEELARYDIVFWETGDERETLSASEQDVIAAYLDQGGDLMLSSTNAGADIGTSAFYNDYLRAEFVTDTLANVFSLNGIESCPFSDPAEMLLFVGAGGAGNYGSLDVIQPIDGAAGAYVYDEPQNQPGGIYYHDVCQVIYLSFPFEAVTGSGSSTSRSELLSNMIDWFESLNVSPEQNLSLPSSAVLMPVFPNPFNDMTRIQFSLPMASVIDLAIYNSIGQKVGTLAKGWLPTGQYDYTWESYGLCSGVYIVRLETGEIIESQRLTLIK